LVLRRNEKVERLSTVRLWSGSFSASRSLISLRSPGSRMSSVGPHLTFLARN
jgi:hypothetical protein